MLVSLNYCSQNAGNFYRAPYYNGNPNIGPRNIGNLTNPPYGKEREKRNGSWGCMGFMRNVFIRVPKGPKYLYGTKYGFCSSNFPYGLGKDSPYGYLGPFGGKPHLQILGPYCSHAEP